MNKTHQKFYYLLRLQFLGFRYHGWQKQPGVKTVQEMIERTLTYVLGEESKFKILGASRTDAMVSAMDFPVELFLESELPQNFLVDFNKNLPADINANSVIEVSKEFNVIQDVSKKEYQYRFSNEEKNPFETPLVTYIHEELDINKMSIAAKVFEGTHDFSSFCYPFELNTTKKREIFKCSIQLDEEYNCHRFSVKSTGFMRHQVRLMMGALFEIGKGNLDQNWLEEALNESSSVEFTYKAPASGLLLYKVEY